MYFQAQTQTAVSNDFDIMIYLNLSMMYELSRFLRYPHHPDTPKILYRFTKIVWNRTKLIHEEPNCPRGCLIEFMNFNFIFQFISIRLSKI